MRTLSADWMANTSKADPEQHSLHQETEEMRQNTFYPRPVAPTAAQVLFMFFSMQLSIIFMFLALALPGKVRVLSDVSTIRDFNFVGAQVAMIF